MDNFLQAQFLDNTVSAWITALGGVILAIAALKLTRQFALASLKRFSAKTKTTLDNFLIRIVERSVLPALYFIAIYTGLQYLSLPQKATHIFNVAILLICTFYAIRLINSIVQYLILSMLKHQDNGDLKQRQAKGLLVIIKVIIWLFGIVFLLDNFGYNVSPLSQVLG
jgi:small-conductance mechanosensitive channel